jgi:hypothetical protein
MPTCAKEQRRGETGGAGEDRVPSLVVRNGELLRPTRRYLPDLPAREHARYAISA